MEGHLRKGRRFYSPIAYTGLLSIGDWAKDDLPDLIWPALVMAENGSRFARNFVQWQKAVQADLKGKVEIGELAELLDGRLTGLRKASELSGSAEDSIRSRAVEFGLLSEPVRRAIATYPDHPAVWLFGDGVDLEQADLDLLARGITQSLGDGHREALIKCLPIWSLVHAGQFRSDDQFIEVLKNYPTDDGTRQMADTMIRASWGAQRGAALVRDPGAFDLAVDWAKVFWGVNSMTSHCIRKKGVEPMSSDQRTDVSSGSTPDHQAVAEPAASDEKLQPFMMDLMSSYCQALETAPSRLYDQERQEVHAGLVSRASREVITALGSPDLWCLEHGAHVGRALVEIRIYLQWMSTQDPTIYKEFQEYGSGKAKLYSKISREVAAPGASSGVDKAVAEFERLSHNTGPLDYRVVDTQDSFANGKSIRTMAEECGLLDFYRRAYSIASGVSHSEWWSLENHCLERCLNILHRGHLIPSLSLNAGGNVELARSWIDSAYALMQISLQILGTDRAAVDAAFAWVKTESQATGAGE